MSTQIRVDTNRLRAHIEFHKEEEKLATDLTEKLTSAKSLANEYDFYDYVRLQNEASDLVHHFSNVALLLDHICENLESLSNTIEMILKDSIEEANI